MASCRSGSPRGQLTRPLAEAADARAVAEFVAANYERYRARPVVRDELDAMAIAARWLSERDGSDGRLIHLRGANLDPAALWHPRAPPIPPNRRLPES